MHRFAQGFFFVLFILIGSSVVSADKFEGVPGYSFRHITDGTAAQLLPRVSTNGLVTWQGWDGDWEIYLYDGTSVEKITENSVPDQRPSVNRHGDLAWTQNAGNERELMIRHDGIVTQITNDPVTNPVEERYPDVNDNGLVVWGRGTSSTGFGFANYDISTETYTYIDSIGTYRPHVSNNNLIEVEGD